MKIILTGYSAELFNGTELDIDEKLSRVSDLKDYLISQKSELADHHTTIAVNSAVAKDSDGLKETDRIIVFHPYSGG